MNTKDIAMPPPPMITSAAKWGSSFVNHQDVISINRNK